MKSVAENRPAFWRRLMWMLAIWGASVLALAAVASIFKLLMYAAGMKTH
ncbi:DUF2474 domain-containing protein [Serratia ficaria]|uniref:Protein of uncharacterized function (DUF2474) n=1 Tax=Serratia ficaria TaxID=61651 RepID=A0A240C7C5_SERFI|nr:MULTISPECIES: DUF2474 domain-containing protein [Serratia]MEE4481664.1 DUF2474 domain-containing protein [Serratia ficaria]REF44166.1 uncharacterized protein DUF2474 [Serratia ficaria]CAI0745793.1 Protein of uncharacterised function (DUF2474) [Serratia ficaria]CAI0750571.1 Protein of uncharacterised function (DUF2474) [Serratia ficaria]CAI0764974.1 Protein of uncharacterised function (DUF2474) [Serratia ficaria]